MAKSDAGWGQSLAGKSEVLGRLQPGGEKGGDKSKGVAVKAGGRQCDPSIQVVTENLSMKQAEASFEDFRKS